MTFQEQIKTNFDFVELPFRRTVEPRRLKDPRYSVSLHWYPTNKYGGKIIIHLREMNSYDIFFNSDQAKNTAISPFFLLFLLKE